MKIFTNLLMKKPFILLFLFVYTLNNGYSQCNNHSANFDGQNGYMLSNLNNSTCSDFTIMLWVKFPNTINAPISNSMWLAAFPTYHSNYSGYTDGIIYESSANNSTIPSKNLHGYSWPNAFAPVHSTQQVYPGNSWIHFAYTRTASGTQKLYINGILNNSANFTGNAFISTLTKFNIGGQGSFMGGSGRWFTNCLIDEVIVYNRVLSQSEIDTKKSQILDVSQETALLGYYRFEEGSGSTTVDQGPTNSTGSLIGGATFSNDTPFGNISSLITPTISGISSTSNSSITTYSIPSTNAFISWVITNGTILSGQGTDTITVQWDSIQPNGLVSVFSGYNSSCNLEGDLSIILTPTTNQICNSYSAYFNGSQAYIESLLNNSTCNDLTIMFWAKFPNTISVPLANSMWLAGFSTYHSNYSGYTDGIFYESGANNPNTLDKNLSGYSWPNYFAPVRSTQQSYQGNTWFHFAYTRTSNGNQKLYIDGSLNNVSTYSQSTFISTQTKLNIGGQGSFMGGIGRWFTNCYIDELVFYNRELSQLEISNKRFQVLDSSQELGLLAYYRFEEGTGTSTADLGPTNSTGTLHQGVTFSGDTPFSFNCNTATSMIEQQKSNSIFITSNDFKNSIDLHFTSNSYSGKYLIYDIQGKLLSSNIIRNHVQNIGISNLSSGVYILSVITSDNICKQLKFVKAN